MKHRHLLAGTALTALAAQATIGAESALPPPDEVTVTAAPGVLLQPVQILSGQELWLKSAPTLGESLANEPGISSTYFGPASSRPVIRGLSGSRVTMLTDGSASLDVADVSADHAVTIEMLLADQVEIIRGPASLLYGSTAAGGIVNVVDSRIPREAAARPLSGAVEVRGDTAADERALVGRLDGGSGNIAWHLDAYTRDTRNIDIPGFATADPAERPEDEVSGKLANSYSESEGYAAGVSWVSQKGFIGAAISRFESLYGLPGPGEGGEDEDEAELFEGAFLDLQQTRVDVRGEYAVATPWLQSLRFALGINDYRHTEIEASGEVATVFDNDQWQARIEAEHTPVAGFGGIIGLQLDDRDFSAVGEEAFVTPTRTEAVGVFLAEERPFSWGTLNLGARVESLEHRNADLPNYDKTAWSMAAGAAVNTPADSVLSLNLSRTQRNPSAEELYSDGAHIATRQFEIGLITAGVSPTTEDSTNVEIGLRRDAGRIQWESSVFYYDISDYVYQNLTGAIEDDLPEAVYTQNDAKFYGAEAAVRLPLWQADSFSSRLRLFGDVVKAELKDGSKLPRIPPWRTGANLAFAQGNGEASLDVVYHASQSDISSFNTDAYTLINASFVYRLEASAANWELYTRINNLTDKEARKSTSFLAAYAPLPARSLSAGIRARF